MVQELELDQGLVQARVQVLVLVRVQLPQVLVGEALKLAHQLVHMPDQGLVRDQEVMEGTHQAVGLARVVEEVMGRDLEQEVGVVMAKDVDLDQVMVKEKESEKHACCVFTVMNIIKC